MPNFDVRRILVGMHPSPSTQVREQIDAQIAAVREEIRRLQLARDILATHRQPRRPGPKGGPRRVRAGAKGVRKQRGRATKAQVTPAPDLRVVQLERAKRPARGSAPSRMATPDDVLALVAAGLDNPSAIADRLYVSVTSVSARLRDLEREGLVTDTLSGWTTTRRCPNWVEYRVRELSA